MTATHNPGSRPPRRARVTRLDIVYEDRVLLVINKPAGLLSVPLPRKSAEPSVYDQLEHYLRPQRRRPFVVHRIDRDTSGLVVFAKDPRTQQTLKKQFIQREPERVYLALVYGTPEPAQGSWRDHLVWDRKALIQKRTHPRDPQGAEAVCRYRVVEQFADVSLLEVRLQTGKRNQIRIQARLRDKRCTHPVWHSAIPPATERCSSRRRCPTISGSCSSGSVGNRSPKAVDARPRTPASSV